MFCCFHLLEVFSHLFNTKILSVPLLGDSRHLSYKVLPTYSAQVTGLTEGPGLPRMQTQHETACGKKTLSGKSETEDGTFTRGWLRKCHMFGNGLLFKLKEQEIIITSILFVCLQIWCSFCSLNTAPVLSDPASTESHLLTSDGGIDLPPANEIKASFSSLCYFQMQPTGRGAREEVGNRTTAGSGFEWRQLGGMNMKPFHKADLRREKKVIKVSWNRPDFSSSLIQFMAVLKCQNEDVFVSDEGWGGCFLL